MRIYRIILLLLTLLSASAFAQQQVVNVGTGPNSGNGDNLRSAGTKINSNFAQLYGMFGSSSNLKSTGSATAADLISLWTGCTGTQYLGADGNCHTGGGTPGGFSYSFQYNNAGALGGVLPGATGLFGLNWSSLTAPPTLTGLGSLATTTPGTGVATALGVNVGSAGAVVVNGGALGTPASGVLTNATGLPISTGVSGLGTGVGTALAVNVGSAGAPVVNGGALGTPSSGVGTNLTGTAAALNIGGTAANITATSNSTLTTLSALASANGSTVPATAGTLNANGASWSMAAGFTGSYGSGHLNADQLLGGQIPTLATGCLQYTGSAFSWSTCGGSPAFSAVTAGTNTAALVVGTGGSMGATGSGTITATAAPVTGITGLGTGVGIFLATPTAANLGSAVTGAGNVAGGGIAVSGTWPTQTISSSYSIRAVSGSSDTILSTDCGNGVYYSNSGAVAVTLPQATGSFAGCGVDISASSATTVTITPTTSTINGAATAVVDPSLWDQVVALSGNYNAYGTAVSFNAGVTYLIDTGAQYTVSGTGACSAITKTGTTGTAAGKFECTGTTGAATFTITLPTALNGWSCSAHDVTTPADTLTEGSGTTTTDVFSGATVASSDFVKFHCIGF